MLNDWLYYSLVVLMIGCVGWLVVLDDWLYRMIGCIG